MSGLPDDMASLDTRALVRRIANEFAQKMEYPSAEQVRKEIQSRSNNTMNPSTSTVQDEMKKWYADTFWPTYTSLSSLPLTDGVPQEMRRLFVDSFQMIVVGAIELAKSNWNAERLELNRAHEADTQRIEQLNQALALEQDRSHALEKQRDEIASSKSLAENKLADLQTAHTSTLASLQEARDAQLTHERQLAEVRETERKQAEAKIDAARDETRRVMRELDALRQEAKGHQQRISQLELELRAEREAAIQFKARAEAIASASTQEKASMQQSHQAEIQLLRESLSVLAKEPSSRKLSPQPRTVTARRLRKPALVKK